MAERVIDDREDGREGESNADLRRLAASLQEGLSTRLGDWFELPEGEGGDEDDLPRVRLAVTRRERGRLAVERGRSADEFLDAVELLADAEAGDRLLTCRLAVLESRAAAVACGSAGKRQVTGRDLLKTPFPPVRAPLADQLFALARRRAAAEERATGIDWAIERVVAELYELTLPQLVMLQEYFAEP